MNKKQKRRFARKVANKGTRSNPIPESTTAKTMQEIQAEKKAEKGKYRLADGAESLSIPLIGGGSSGEGRGYNVYSISDLQRITGRGKNGQNISGNSGNNYFELSVDERVQIYQKADPVTGVVNSRMNRISSMEWEIVPNKFDIDRIIEEIRDSKSIIDEWSKNSMGDMAMSMDLMNKKIQLRKMMPDLLPDMSNFSNALLRWKRKTQQVITDKADMISDWVSSPNNNDSFSEFIKRWVFDLMVHGATSIYKEEAEGRVNNIHVLPGGSVIPLTSKFVGGATVYAQMTYLGEVQMFYKDELSFSQYLPTSFRTYPMIPLDALLNKVVENLFVDKKMADQADGTRPPEKMVVFGGESPYGAMDEAASVPINKEEQKRIETKMNEERKWAIATLTGYGTPTVLDLSRENLMPLQTERQKMIRETVAFVFNMSNMEVNLTGSEDTSGRSTSEEQGEIDYGKGIWPIMQIIEEKFNEDILPYVFGSGYKFRWKRGKNEEAERKRRTEELASGLRSVNEIRVNEMNEKPFDDAKFDLPFAGQPQAPDGSEMSPLFTQPTKGK